MTQFYYAVPAHPEQTLYLTWPELGIYFFLRKANQPFSIDQLMHCGYSIPKEVVSHAIDSLIKKELIRQELLEEVHHE